MRSLRWISCLSVAYCIGLFSLPIFAEELFSLQALFDLAERANPTLQAERQNEVMATADKQIAGYLSNPQLGGYYGFGRATTQLGNPQGMSVTQNLELGGKRRARLQVAIAKEGLSEAEFQQVRWKLQMDIKAAYLEVLAAEALHQNWAEQMAALDRLLQVTQKRLDAGMIPETERLQVQLMRAQLKPQVFESLGNIQQKRITLNTLLGNQLPQGFQLEDEVHFSAFNQPDNQSKPVENEVIETDSQFDVPEPLSLPELLSRAMANRAEMKAASAQELVAKRQLKLSQRLRIPDLLTSAGYLFVVAPAPSSPTADKDFFGGGYVSAMVTLPVFHNQGAEIRKSQAQLVQAQFQRLASLNQVQEEVQQAYVSLQAAKETLLLEQKELLPESRRVLLLVQRGYAVGKSSLSQVILSQKAYQEARQTTIQSLLKYHLARLSLEKALGQSL